MENRPTARPTDTDVAQNGVDHGHIAAPRLVRALERGSRWAERLGELAAVLCVVVFTLLVVAGVFFRYVLGQPLSWNEEVVRFALIWMTFIGGSVALKRGEHVAVDIVQRTLRSRVPWGALVLSIFSNLAISVFVALVLVHGTQLVVLSIPQVTPTLRVSQAWPYLGIPIGAGLMLLHSLYFIARDLSRLRFAGRDAGSVEEVVQ